MQTESLAVRILWPLLASLAGAITALSFRPYKKMTSVDIVLALIVGASFATFVGPAIVDYFFPESNSHIQGAAYYILASGSNVFIPLIIRKGKKYLGLVDEASQ